MSTTTDLILFLGGIGVWTLGFYMGTLGMQPANYPLTFGGGFMAGYFGFNLLRSWWRSK